MDRSLKKKSLCAEEVCSIIESCATHKVTSLKFGDLEVSFGPQALTEPAQVQIPSNPEAEISELPQRTKEEIAILEADLREMENAELALTNPRLMEDLIERGELDDADDDDASSE
jgi:hypothetical protein